MFADSNFSINLELHFISYTRESFSESKIYFPHGNINGLTQFHVKGVTIADYCRR